MSLEEAISTEPIKEKLKNLRQYMPGQLDEIYDFAAYLAGRLNPQLLPRGFYITAKLALYDLEKDVNGLTGQRIRSTLVGYPSLIYELLRVKIPEIAKAVCPEDFAKGVQEFYEQINAIKREGEK